MPTKEEFVTLVRILNKSEHVKNYISGTARLVLRRNKSGTENKTGGEWMKFHSPPIFLVQSA